MMDQAWPMDLVGLSGSAGLAGALDGFGQF